MTGNHCDPNAARRILIISTTFLPHPYVGAVRMTQWCRYLPECGWHPTVLCRHYGYTATPDLIASEVHPAVTVSYLNSPIIAKEGQLPGCHSLRDRARRYAANVARVFAVPDQSVIFWRRIRKHALRMAEQVKPHVILTTSPPHSTHDVGLWLSSELGTPWVADFRDPFTVDPRFRRSGLSAVRWPAVQRFEAQIYARAKLILHAIPIHARWARLRYPAARSKIQLLSNGVPHELTAAAIRSGTGSQPRKSIRVVGLLDNAAVLVLAQAVRSLVLAGHDLELRLVGKPPTNLCAIQSVLCERLVSMGLVQHSVALEQIAGADILVCALDRSKSQILGLSSKLFEYLAVGRPIISINPTVPDQQLLRGYLGVQCLHDPSLPEVVGAIAEALVTPREALVHQSSEFAGHYGRRAQVKRLAEWLDHLVLSH